jgi:hypothetical protein
MTDRLKTLLSPLLRRLQQVVEEADTLLERLGRAGLPGDLSVVDERNMVEAIRELIGACQDIEQATKRLLLSVGERL